MEPAGRKAAILEVADYLRKSQSQRIADQRNPDGSPYEPRRPREQLAKRQGAINPRVGYVASVHHYGLRDKVDRRICHSPDVRYARRELLGYTDEEIKAIEEILIKHAV